MMYILSAIKALALVAAIDSTPPTLDDLHVGDPALCPYQVDSRSDEEYECEVFAVSTQARVVVLRRVD